MKKLIAGNWKMNCTLTEAKYLIADIVNGISDRSDLTDKCKFLVCPPFIYLPTIRHATVQYGTLSYGAQDCSEQENGAYTGDISADMLKESGCTFIICGHSERRQYHKESNALILKKAEKVQEKEMCAIICIGESEKERDAGKHLDVVLKQLEECLPEGSRADNTVIAYEPVWAIGTGKTATAEDIEDMHGAIRDRLRKTMDDADDVRILYGGSVKPGNAQEIFSIENVDGALIGGASLSADDFLGIADKV